MPLMDDGLRPPAVDQLINGIGHTIVNIFRLDLFRGGCLGAGQDLTRG